MSQNQDSASKAAAPPAQSFIIVGIGASAGGLEALETFLAHLPAQTGMAFVLVQHLDPSHTSLMPELLTRLTTIPVQVAADALRVQPNRLYVMPPNVTLTIHGGVLRASTPAAQSTVRTHIDTFLRSLAEDQGQHAVGVVLSGAGSDGTMGLKAIKEHGGITVVQSPSSAKYDSMPLSAIATGLVDFTLPAEEIPAQLVAHAVFLENLERHKSFEALRQEAAAYLPRICQILHHVTGHDFSGYKPSTMVRRVERRMQVRHLDSVAPYVAQLEQNPQEAELLFKDLLIGVTQFFRDPEAFDALAAQALPKLLEHKGAGAPIRVWVPGCASGEEAYSIAMLLCEHMTQRTIAPPVQIFATDIDDEAIAAARLGRYPASLVEQLSPERRERFFLRHGDLYQVNKQLRDLCVFSLHNLVRDPPFSSLDLISCRTLLIYLDSALQKMLVPLFHYALAPGGYLLLGSSEGVADFAGLFREVDKKHRLFQRLQAAVSPSVAFPLAGPILPLGRHAQPARPAERLKTQDIGAIVARMVSDYAPPCVVINERADIIYSSGETSLYLQPPTGAATLGIIDQARQGLRLSLRTAIREALDSRAPVVHGALAVRTPAGLRTVDLIVRPLPELGTDSHLLAVVFQAAARAKKPARPPASPAEESAVHQLESELKTARGELQTTVEELQTANEELKSSNEELLSMNEELQSANEELQTSKEEMQSVNEELATVNAELNRKVEQLNAAHADLQNLFRSTEIATLFLDRELRIKRFTPAASAIFHLLDGDLGRPITDFAPRFADLDLVAEITRALRDSSTRELPAYFPETQSWFMLRILPSRTMDNAIDGVVVTLANVTALKQAEEALRAEAALRASERFHRAIGESIAYGIWICDAQGRNTYASDSFLKLLGITQAQCADLGWADLLHPDDASATIAAWQQCVQTGGPWYREHRYRGADGQWHPILACGVPVRDERGDVAAWAGINLDISRLKGVEDALRESENRYRTLFESMDEGFALCELLYDPAGNPIDFRYLNVNPAFEKLTGLPPEKVLGRRASEAIPGIERFWIEHYAQVVRTGQSQRFANQVAVLGRHFEVYAYAPAPDRFAAIFMDVTERKLAEERLQLYLTVFQAAANAIVITGADGAIQWVNPAFTRLTGYSADEALGRNPRLLKSGRQDSAVYTRLWETIAAGRVWQGEMINRCKDGTLYDEEMIITPVRNAAGEIAHYVAIKQDITLRKHAEQLLRQVNVQLEERVAQRTHQLASSNADLRAQMDAYQRLEAEVANLVEDERVRLGMELHDNLCQQLAASGMLTATLVKGLREKESAFADTAARIAASLTQAGDDARDLSHGLLPVQVDVDGLMMALSALAHRTTEMQNVPCAFECAVPVPVESNATATHFFRIAQEAVNNAIKHGKAKNITLARANDDAVTLTLTISDDGVGIPHENTRVPGSGLRIMAYRARVIGADLAVDPATSGGTVVRCVLRRAAGDA